MSISIDYGGAAFPRQYYDMDSIGEMRVRYSNTGMTLRDWFAGQALQAILASLKEKGIQERDIPKMAADCYCVSDAMLAERAKREKS